MPTLTVRNFIYVPPPAGGANSTGCVDWDRRTLYAFADDFYSFNIDTQVIINHGGPFTNLNLNTSSLDVGKYDGRIYNGTGTTSRLFIGYNSSTGATERVYNDVAAQLAPSGNMRMATAGGSQIAVGAGLNSGQGGGNSAPIFAVNMDTLTALGPTYLVFVPEINTSIAPGNVWLGPGPDGQVCASSLGINSGVSGTMGLYLIALTSSTFGVTRVGGYTASTFGFTGTLNFIGYPMIDQADGNIVCCLQSSSGQFALCKFSSLDGHIIWQNSFGFLINLCFVRSVHGSLKYLGSGGRHTLNTLTATEIVETISGSIAQTSFLHSDDVTGLDVYNTNNNPGANPQWATFAIPPPMTIGGGILRARG